MSRDDIAGATDYSHQTLNSIIEDLNDWCINLDDTILFTEKQIQKINTDNNYWNDNVYSGFKDAVAYSLKFFKTAKEELESIKQSIPNGVEANHSTRVGRIGKTALEINLRIGKIWNSDYPYGKKDYGSSIFRQTEEVYCKVRDMAVDLMDLGNIPSRLDDFVGYQKDKKDNDSIDALELKPNFFGIGLNFNHIIKKIQKHISNKNK
ncbi:MAG: hypothetical protein PHX30_03010 [Candidatus Pacebacteria bacterium]|nr:hypothetical protein [Candidatus Paceibacterota bacterium]